MPCNAPSELYLLKTHYLISRHLGLPFVSQPWMRGPHLLIHPIAELLPTLFYSYHPLYSLAYEVYQTDLKSTTNSPALLAEIYLGTHDSTNQVAECEDHIITHHGQKTSPHALSTIVMDFLVLGTLTLLRLLLWSLQVQLLSVVVAKGLRVERIHQAL